MISEKKIEHLEHSAVKLSVTVGAAEVRKAYDKMMKEYANNVRVDGFRIGHVPASVLERKFGDSLRLDAMGRVLEAAVEEAVKDIEEKPLAYDSPSLDGQPEFAIDKDFSFAVTYDVFPTVVAPSLEGLSITIPKVEITKADIDRELEEIRQRNALVVEKQGPAGKGDIVTLDWQELGPDGEAVQGSARQDFTFEIGTGYNLYKFDDEIEGLAAGQEKRFSKSFTEGYEYPELVGKTVTLEVKVTKVKEKKVPALDDELAQDVSEKYSTLADLVASVEADLKKHLEDRLRHEKEHAVTDELLKRGSPDLPASMVAAELAMRWDSLKRQMGVESDEKLEQIAAYSGKTREALMEDWKPSAEKGIATRLLVEKLVEQGGFVCTDEDLEAEYARQAEGGAMSVAEVKAEYEKRGSAEYLRERIREDKFFDAVISGATVVEGESVSYVDFAKENE
ncbi:MAG: trigger factor [Rectinemataceae bacterium]